jgi:SseB protein N-terminal domain
MTQWEPANDVEQAMLDAARADDRQGFFQLVAVADLFLPQQTGDPRGRQRFVTFGMLGQTFLPVFTSWQALAAQFRGAVDGYTITNYAELSRKWPNPAWRLAINPGTPLDAYLTVQSVADAAVGDVEVPTLPEMARAAQEDEAIERRLRERQAAGDYPDDPAEALAAAAEAADAYGYVDRLLDAMVLVPTSRPVEADAILEAGFPWRPSADGAAIEVFTTREAFARVHADTVPAVEVAMPFALAMWPEGYGLSVNPGGDDGIDLPPEQVILLLLAVSSEE